MDTFLNSLPADRRPAYTELMESVTGRTPLHRIAGADVPNANRIYLKLEYHNIGGVHHSRIYPAVFAHAEAGGVIAPGVTPVIEASAGGAAIAFTYCANRLGFNTPHLPQVVVPAYLSPAREEKLKALNAVIHKVPPGSGQDATVHHLEKLLAADRAQKGGALGDDPRRLFCCTKIQPGMEDAYASLADEAWEQMGDPNRGFDYFVGCVGSGSSISGVGRRMKALNPEATVLAAEHEVTPVSRLLREDRRLTFSSQPHPFHGAAHWGVGLDKLNIDYEVIDGFECFDTETARETQARVNQAEGLSVGLTTSAALSVAFKVARRAQDKNILVIAYDSFRQSRVEADILL